MVALMVLGILVVIVLYSAQVAFYEQRTAINENRAQLVTQAAEYSINLAGEYLTAVPGSVPPTILWIVNAPSAVTDTSAQAAT